MSSLLCSIVSLVLGFVYLYFNYERPVGWMQIVLGALCTVLSVIMLVKDHQAKRKNTAPDAAAPTSADST